MEFVNSTIDYDAGIQPGGNWEGFAKNPEAYEALPTRSTRDGETECLLKDHRDKDEPDTSAALPGTSLGMIPTDTLVVSVPDKNPSCPSCDTQFNWMLGLIDHLKRTHRKRKIIFKCLKCGKENLKYHSICCHFPQCKGNVEVVPKGDWICEVCQRAFSTKIGLGQHKRLAHPLVMNLQQNAAPHPKETSVRGAHQEVWTEEEEALLRQLVIKYDGNINNLTAEHIPSKMAKHVCDKRCLLKILSKTVQPDIDG